MQDLFDQTTQQCDSLQHRVSIRTLLHHYPDVFSKGNDDMGSTDLVGHEIPTKLDAHPIRQAIRRLGPEKGRVARQVWDMEERSLIKPSNSAWSSPAVLVKKKNGKWRFYIDCRHLNEATEQDPYPVPRIDETLDALPGSKFFLTLDLLSGYWQMPLSQDVQSKAAFITRGGLWEWKVLPFDLTSAPATFQHLMERVVRGLHWRTLLLYLDDIIVIGPDFQTLLTRLEEVLERLRGAGLKLKPASFATLACPLNRLMAKGHPWSWAADE